MKNGTARFQNLDQLINEEGEGDPDVLDEMEKDPQEDKSNSFEDNPLDNSDSFNDLIKVGRREKGFSISDIPKLPIDKMNAQNNENLGITLNNNFNGISYSYDPSINNKDYKESKVDKNDSDLLSMNKSLDFNNYRLPFKMKTNDLNTFRESEYSWHQKSKLDYDDEDMILGSALHNASQTQEMIKDFLDSDSNALNTARSGQDKSEIKEEIDILRDKIFRSLEEYKIQVESL